jgi:hypothetical protein
MRRMNLPDYTPGSGRETTAFHPSSHHFERLVTYISTRNVLGGSAVTT